MKQLKRRIYYKGGGGTETVQAIPDWAIPYMKNVGNEAESAYGVANLGNVAGTNPLLQNAYNASANNLGQQAGESQDAISRSRSRLEGMAGGQGYNPTTTAAAQQRMTDVATKGAYDTSAIKDAAIRDAGKAMEGIKTSYADRGTLGSARQAIAESEVDAATRAQFAKIDYDAAQQNFQNKITGENQLQGYEKFLSDLNDKSLNNKLQVEGAITSQAPVGVNIAGDTAKTYLGLGNSARDVEQQTGDAPWQALQRYASTIYGNPARQSQAASSGGK